MSVANCQSSVVGSGSQSIFSGLLIKSFQFHYQFWINFFLFLIILYYKNVFGCQCLEVALFSCDFITFSHIFLHILHIVLLKSRFPLIPLICFITVSNAQNYSENTKVRINLSYTTMYIMISAPISEFLHQLLSVYHVRTIHITIYQC